MMAGGSGVSWPSSTSVADSPIGASKPPSCRAMVSRRFFNRWKRSDAHVRITKPSKLYHNLRENLVAPLERLIDGRCRRHAILDHVGMSLAPDLLGVALAPGRRECIVERHGRVQGYFRDIWL